MKRYYLLFLFCIAALICCDQKTTPTPEPVDHDVHDSCLTIGLLPTLDCLPFQVAKDEHLFDSLGLSVTFRYFASQMDAELALIQNEVSMCASDLFRIVVMQSQKQPVRYLFSTHREWNIISNKKLRISRIQQLGDRIVGISRNSTEDYICDQVVSILGNKKQILRPQINDLLLRQEMMEKHQIDVALLPHPLALLSTIKGNDMLPLLNVDDEGFCGFALSLQSGLNEEDTKRLFTSYNLAVERLLSRPRLQLSNAAIAAFHLQKITDSIRPKEHFQKASIPTVERINTASKWLSGKQLLPTTFSTDTLLLH